MFFNLHERLRLRMRISFANEGGDMLIKAMQITAPKSQPRCGPESATMANSSLVLDFAANWRRAGQRSRITVSVLAAGPRGGARVMDTSLHNGVLIDTVSGKS